MQSGKTRWKPDTCGCIVVYNWVTVGGEPQILTPYFEQSCDAHAPILDPMARFVAVRADNLRDR